MGGGFIGSRVGGIVGQLEAFCVIENSISRGDIRDLSLEAGGLAGYVYPNASVQNSLSTSYVKATTLNKHGAVFGFVDSGAGTISNVFYDISAVELSNDYGTDSTGSPTITSYYMPQMKSNANFGALSTTYWSFVPGEYPTLAWRIGEETCDAGGSPFGGGQGTAYSPYLLCSLAQVEAINGADYSEKVFLMTDDIDMTGTTFAPMVNGFKGVFLGNYKTLSNWIYSSGVAQNSFFNTTFDAYVEDLYFDSMNITGNGVVAIVAFDNDNNSDSLFSNIKISNSSVDTSANYAGVAFSVSKGRVYDILGNNNTITVSNTTSFYVGGLFGGIGGNVTRRVQNLGGSVQCNSWCGGVVGTLTWNSVTGMSAYLKQVKSNTTVQSSTPVTWGNRSGGIVGAMNYASRLEDAYYEGTVGVKEWYGGLIGTHGGSAGTNAVDRAWVLVQLTGGTTCDGLVFGQDEGDTGVFSEVYADTQASSSTDMDGCGSDTGYTGANTATMQTAATYGTWPTEIWDLQNGDYPRFTWE
ncbi:MAG: hypothetical protein H6621_09595 [Halobacteriovoraceae bacterium]|nr:hypothetical protein [Halobacteriovoraceae bacterium]MCB9095310.1 hypothetical protein [Halobacteriovoraceae bacterium]